MPKKVVHLLTIFIAPIFFLPGCCTEEWEGPPGDISMTTPYVNQSDMIDTVGPFSAIHHGLDFFPDGDLKPFQAVASGRVEDVKLFYNDISYTYQVNILIKYNSTYTASYAFEPCSANIEDGNIQMSLITVGNGQMVNAGDEIGKLHVVVFSSHVDFGLLRSWEGICPYPYFTTEARDSILSLSYDGRMCDCHP